MPHVFVSARWCPFTRSQVHPRHIGTVFEHGENCIGVRATCKLDCGRRNRTDRAHCAAAWSVSRHSLHDGAPVSDSGPAKPDEYLYMEKVAPGRACFAYFLNLMSTSQLLFLRSAAGTSTGIFTSWDASHRLWQCIQRSTEPRWSPAPPDGYVPSGHSSPTPQSINLEPS